MQKRWVRTTAFAIGRGIRFLGRDRYSVDYCSAYLRFFLKKEIGLRAIKKDMSDSGVITPSFYSESSIISSPYVLKFRNVDTCLDTSVVNFFVHIV